MSVTLEQARALDALARFGTLTKAAASLHKKHTAVVYALANLELQTGLTLLDRSGYRTSLTHAGERVLEQCRKLLAQEAELEALCTTIRTGWEPRLRVVFDGLFPPSLILREVKRLSKVSPVTRVDVVAEYLSGVEQTYFARNADLMVSVLPPKDAMLERCAAAPIASHLVVHKRHPLARVRKATLDDLRQHTLLTVRGSDPRLALTTAPLDAQVSVQLHDFHTKREAILAEMGFGWLPDYLIAPELTRGTVVRVAFVGGNRHVFTPHLYWAPGRAHGRAAQHMVQGLTKPL